MNEGEMGCGGYRTKCLPTRAQGAQARAPYGTLCHMDGSVVPSCPRGVSGPSQDVASPLETN